MLEILPRLNSSNVSRMLYGLGYPNLIFTSISWARDSVAKFFLRNYTFDLSVHDDTGANALALAAKANMPEVVRLILDERGDLINSQDDSGRTPLSWAAEKSMGSARVLLGHKDIRPELVDSWGLAPIDILLQELTPTRLTVIPLMVPFLAHGINRIVWHGCTLLHVLIETVHSRPWISGVSHGHWKKLKHPGHGGRKIFERVKFRPGVKSQQVIMSHFRQALGAVSVSADEVRSSPCKCGIGTIFLAISTENVKLVEVLLDFYPDLVNDRFFDGSSPLDLANCFVHQNRRKAMIDLILSKDPIAKTCTTSTQTSGIRETNPDEVQDDCKFTDLEIRQRQRDHAGRENDNG